MLKKILSLTLFTLSLSSFAGITYEWYDLNQSGKGWKPRSERTSRERFLYNYKRNYNVACAKIAGTTFVREVDSSQCQRNFRYKYMDLSSNGVECFKIATIVTNLYYEQYRNGFAIKKVSEELCDATIDIETNDIMGFLQDNLELYELDFGSYQI